MRKLSRKLQKYLLLRQERLAKHKKKRLKRKKDRARKVFNKKIQEKKKAIPKIIPPPGNFSFVNNPEELLHYFGENGKLLKKGQAVSFDLSHIENLTFDALSLLLAKVYRNDYRYNSSVRGKAPINPELKRIFKDSGFLDHVNSNLGVSPRAWEMIHHCRENQIKFDTDRQVDVEISGKVALAVMNHVFGNENYTQLHPIFIECMANTCNHTTDGYDWWLFYFNEPKTRISKICFIDLGGGILETLNSRWEKLRVGSWLIENREKLRRIFAEEIEVPTSTHKPERGWWLITMKHFAERPEVQKFTIISNDVYYEVKNDISRTLSRKFSGTFIYWELHPITN